MKSTKLQSKEIEFEIAGKIYRKFTGPFRGTVAFREFSVDRRAIINPKPISRSTFYLKLRKARASNSAVKIYY